MVVKSLVRAKASGLVVRGREEERADSRRVEEVEHLVGVQEMQAAELGDFLVDTLAMTEYNNVLSKINCAFLNQIVFNLFFWRPPQNNGDPPVVPLHI